MNPSLHGLLEQVAIEIWRPFGLFVSAFFSIAEQIPCQGIGYLVQNVFVLLQPGRRANKATRTTSKPG